MRTTGAECSCATASIVAAAALGVGGSSAVLSSELSSRITATPRVIGLLFLALTLSACHHHHHDDEAEEPSRPAAEAVLPAPQLSQSGSLALQSYDDTTNSSGQVATSGRNTLYHEGSLP